jgi:hypothetical protein
MIWKNTTKIGCGISISPTYALIGVCNYEPAGNIVGYFRQNVLPIDPESHQEL